MSPQRITSARPGLEPYPVRDWVRQYYAGISTVRIACDSNVSSGTVTKILRLAGVPLRGTKARWEDAQ